MASGFLRRGACCLLGLGALGLLAGCGITEKDAGELLNCDFEQFDGWVSAPPVSLSGERAHSGRFSYCLKPGEEFGSSYQASLARCPQPPTHLRLEGWTYLPSTPLGSTMLVIEVHCNGRRPDVWINLKIDQVVRRYEQWEHFTKTARLPADLEPTDEIKLYVWCPERGMATKYFDDLTLVGWR